MTVTVVSTDIEYASTEGFFFAASGDAYILLPGVVATNQDGFGISSGPTLSDLSLNLNGVLVSSYAAAVWLESSATRVAVGSTGRLYAEFTPGNYGVVSMFGTNSSLTNAGEIVTASGTGVVVANWHCAVTNTGLISGRFAGVELQASNGSITNSGIIEASAPDGQAIRLVGGTGSVFNAGTITGGVNLVQGLPVSAGIFVGVSATGRIVNTGTIATPSGFGIQTADLAVLDLTNAGVISGAIAVPSRCRAA